MPDFSKLDWFASWQNAVSFLAAVGATIWLGDMPGDKRVLVFLVAFAVARLLSAIMQALWNRSGPETPKTD